MFWSLFNHRQKSNLCCSSPCFCVLLSTHYRPLQCFSTFFRKLKEIGDLRPIFPDYAISCDYALNEFLLSPWTLNDRSSQRRCSIKKKAVLKNFAIFAEKYLCWSLFLIKLQTYEELCHNNLQLKALNYCCKALHRPVTLLKRDSSLRALILRAPTLKNICEWLRLEWRFIELTVLPEFNQFLQRLSYSIYTFRSSHWRCFIKKRCS